MCSRWSEFRYIVLYFAVQKMRFAKEQKEGRGSGSSSFFYVRVCLTEAEGGKRDATNTPATSSTGC
jgi:hypothetical protein